MSVLRCSRDFMLPHFCLLLTSCLPRPRQHLRATTIRRSHEMRSTVADWSHPNFSHNHGRGSSSDDDDWYSIRRVPTPWLSSTSQPLPYPEDRIPTTPIVHLPPGIQSPPASDADGSLTGFRPVDCPFCNSPTFSANCVSWLPSFWLSLIASLLAPLFIVISAADVRQTSSRSSRGTWSHEGIGPECVGKPSQRPVARCLRSRRFRLCH